MVEQYLLTSHSIWRSGIALFEKQKKRSKIRRIIIARFRSISGLGLVSLECLLRDGQKGFGRKEA